MTSDEPTPTTPTPTPTPAPAPAPEPALPARHGAGIDHEGESGRPIVLTPLAPGLWTIIMGGVFLVLGPLFGFLIGSMLATSNEVWGMSPMYLWLFLGFLVAGVGLAVVLLGARRLWRTARVREV